MRPVWSNVLSLTLLWACSSTHTPSAAPHITTQPSSISVNEGASATFTVVATGNPAPSYQWQESSDGATWTAVARGTGKAEAAYTTVATSAADDGKLMRVIVANTAGQETSRSATLHVGQQTVTHGSQIDESNTGVPAGHTLVDVASTIIVTEDWVATQNGGSRVLMDRNFLSGADLLIAVKGFTIKDCRFNGRSGLSENPNTGGLPLGSNIVVEDSEFDGKHENTGGAVAVFASNLTLRRVHIHRWPRALFTGDGNIWLEECYLHDLTADGGDAHLENVYDAGGSNQTFLRNKLISNEVHINGDSRMMTSASLAIYNESYDRGMPYGPFPPLDNILVQDNYFESDGHYTLYAGACEGKAGVYARHTVFTGNIFGRTLHRHSGVSGPAVAFNASQEGNQWVHNTWGPRGPEWQQGDPEEGAEVSPPTVR